jgi:hypothetical protein
MPMPVSVTSMATACGAKPRIGWSGDHPAIAGWIFIDT